MPKETFRPPASLAEATARRRDLQYEIDKIQLQLSERNRVDGTGKRLNTAQYLAWRRRAHYSLNELLSELRLINAWIRDHAVPRPLFPALEEALHLLEQLTELLNNLKEDDVDFDQEERALVEEARAFIDRFKSPSPS